MVYRPRPPLAGFTGLSRPSTWSFRFELHVLYSYLFCGPQERCLEHINNIVLSEREFALNKNGNKKFWPNMRLDSGLGAHVDDL